jgi:hypothetical protein
VDSHDGAIKADTISMCLDHYNKEPSHWLDPQKRLCDVGVNVEGATYKIIYDYVPISYPLLTTPPINVFDNSSKGA